MKVYTTPRGRGKTTTAVEMAIELDACLVVKNTNEVHRVSSLHPNLKFIVTYEDVLRGIFRDSVVETVVVDNIDDFVVLACRVNGVIPVLGTIDTDFETRQQLNDMVRLKEKNKKRKKVYGNKVNMKKWG